MGSFAKIKYLRIPGHEVIGIIDKLEPNISGYAIGLRVGVGWPAGITYDGGFAEYMVTRPEHSILIPGSRTAKTWRSKSYTSD